MLPESHRGEACKITRLHLLQSGMLSDLGLAICGFSGKAGVYRADDTCACINALGIDVPSGVLVHDCFSFDLKEQGLSIPDFVTREYRLDYRNEL
jgi:hypothetical protein